MGAGDSPRDASETELMCTRLVNKAMQLGLGFSEAQLSCAIKHYLKIFESSNDAMAYIPQDNFAVVVDYILDNQELEHRDQRKIETITLSGDSEKSGDQKCIKVSTNELSDDSFDSLPVDSGARKAGRLDRNAMRSFYKTKMNKSVVALPSANPMNDNLLPKANGIKSSVDEKPGRKPGLGTSGLNMCKRSSMANASSLRSAGEEHLDSKSSSKCKQSPIVNANTMTNVVHEQLNIKPVGIAPDSVIFRQSPKNVVKSSHEQSNVQTGSFQSSTLKNRQSCSTNTCTTTEILQFKGHQNREMNGYNTISVPLRLNNAAVNTELSLEPDIPFSGQQFLGCSNEINLPHKARNHASSPLAVQEQKHFPMQLHKQISYQEGKVADNLHTLYRNAESTDLTSSFVKDKHGNFQNVNDSTGIPVNETYTSKVVDLPSSSRAILYEASNSKAVDVPSSSRAVAGGSSSRAVVGEASTSKASDVPSSSSAGASEASMSKASDVPSSSMTVAGDASTSKPTDVPSISRFLELETYLKEGKCEMALKAFLSWKEEGFKVESIPADNGDELSNIPGKKKGFIISLDITRGLEKLPISCVNEYNSVMLPEDFLYITRSVIRSGAHVDTSFSRIGDLHCSCDDCVRSPEACKCNDSTRGECAYDSEGRLISRLASNFQSNWATKSGDFITECCDKCQCSIICGNRVVQRGITRKLQVFMTPKKGWGVRALEKIPARSFIFEYIGEIATNEEQYHRNKEYKKNGVYTYTMNLDADYDMEEKHFREGLTDSELLVLDATMYGNVARFVNHRCNDANLFMRPVQIESRDTHYYHAAFFAVRDIEEMEELTWDYGIDFDDTSHEVKAFMCHCRSPYCRDNRKKRKVTKPKLGTKKAKLATLVP